MSAPDVRTGIKNYLVSTFPTDKIIDLSGQYLEHDRFLAANGLTRDSVWVGLQFIGDAEEVNALATINGQGFWVEYGMVYVHVCGPANALGGINTLIAKAHEYRKKLRSLRLGKLTIEGTLPPMTDEGAALIFESGAQAATVGASYRLEIANNE